MLVIAYHAGGLAGAASVGPIAPVVAELKAGVVVFFVISGFLLYLPYARSIQTGSPLPGWRAFAARRALRILPGYWAALTLLAWAGLVVGVISPDWWRFFGLAQVYDPRTLKSGLGVAWTLCVEISFYATLPVAAWAIARLARTRSSAGSVRLQLAVIAGFALCSLGVRAWLAQSLLMPVPDARIVLATALPGLLDWFAVGMGLAVLRAGWEEGTQISPVLVALARRPGLCWLVATVVYLCGVLAQHGELFLSSYGVATHLAIGIAATLVVLPAVLQQPRARRSVILSLLCTRPLVWLGTISYGMYLWHVPFLQTLDRWTGNPRGALAFAGLFVATLAGAACLGTASWYLVERPAQEWWRRRRGSADVRRAQVPLQHVPIHPLVDNKVDLVAEPPPRN
jgi:peptidoglycan/LPS O-acetylase OafA/YrhL